MARLKGPADTDSFGISKDDANKNIGLARTITNPTYKYSSSNISI
ncbi:hypothetical protein [Mycoplasmopsis cynos]|nr:hypothetical protein [Mycoplasmopsis cynos]UWV77493.1 hypothetical protein NW070_00775 [Mycoplasmopsis cynos]